MFSKLFNKSLINHQHVFQSGGDYCTPVLSCSTILLGEEFLFPFCDIVTDCLKNRRFFYLGFMGAPVCTNFKEHWGINYQWRIQCFPDGGGWVVGRPQPIIWKMFAKNCLNTEIWPRSGARPLRHLDPLKTL